MANGNESQSQPLCGKHTNVHMQWTGVEGRAKSGEPGWHHCYGCPRDGCSRCYTAEDGYFDQSAGEPPYFPLTGHRCPKHDDMFLYLQSHDNELHVDTWRCPEIGCEMKLIKPTSECQMAR